MERPLEVVVGISRLVQVSIEQVGLAKIGSG
jgi:hypothetical protein